MAERPRFAVRGSCGVSVMELSKSVEDCPNFEKDKRNLSNVMEFSSDGKLLAWCNSACVIVFDFRFNEKIQIPRQRTNIISFSPQNNYLVTWETLLATKDGPQNKDNLEIWKLDSGSCVKGFLNKKKELSALKWSDDEKICGKCVTNEIQFFEDGNFDNVSNRLRLQGVNCFEIAKGYAPYKIAAYVRGSKAAPSYVKLFQYPNFDASSALAHKSFFKAEEAQIIWNKKGTAALILTRSEVDTTGGSYYGEQGLHYIATNGDSSLVTLAKKGPIYSVDWNPNCLQFCVVHGYMPAKATLFNLKCDVIFDFGTGPRNNVYYNAHGNILCLAGFGNLRGQMEFWDLKQMKEINKIQASDSTEFEWCPDGQHFFTATTSPRLREGNGYKIWHYSGKCVFEKKLDELWQISWQPCKDGVFPELPITGGIEVPKAKVEAYRPPQARGTQSTLKLHEIEPAQNQKPRELSGAALKNKKKREAKARNKQAELNENNAGNVANSSEILSSSLPVADKEKKIRNLRKKLRKIEDLKQQKKEGKQLENNQEEKITNEDSLLEEIRQLELS